VSERVVLELIEHPVLQMSPFTDGLALVIALLPAMHTVLGGAVSLVFERDFLLDRIAGLQTPLEGGEHLRDVIGELCAREAREGRELGVGFDRALPTAQDRTAACGEMSGERRELFLDDDAFAHVRIAASGRRCVTIARGCSS
jgi:hypothetical protein